VQAAESGEYLPDNPDEIGHLAAAFAGTLEKLSFLDVAGGLAPAGDIAGFRRLQGWIARRDRD
jgi:hypothetical protein